MYVIVNLLSNMLGRTVVNNTGLSGKYDVSLVPLAESLSASSAYEADDMNLVLIDAIEKQLGLKTETIRAADEILVIDHIERPSAN
jgi:uncharacterized protein (TIGR03435 family)